MVVPAPPPLSPSDENPAGDEEAAALRGEQQPAVAGCILGKRGRKASGEAEEAVVHVVAVDNAAAELESPLKEDAERGRVRGAFSAAGVRECLKRGGYAQEVCDGAAVYLSAVLEQITGRLLGSAGVETHDNADDPKAPVSPCAPTRARECVGGRSAKVEKRIVPKAIRRALAKDVAMQRCLAGLAAMDGVDASGWCRVQECGRVREGV